MRFDVVNEQPGRMRIALSGRIPANDEGPLEQALIACSDIRKVVLYPRIGGIVVRYEVRDGARDRVVSFLRDLGREDLRPCDAMKAPSFAPRSRVLLSRLSMLVASYLLRRAFLPTPLAFGFACWRWRSFVKLALPSLAKGKMDVSVLDAVAIGVSLLRGDFKTAGQTMMLLQAGEILEEYTKERSENELLRSLLEVPERAQLVCDGSERSVAVSELSVGDVVVVRTGMPVSVDGTVDAGVAMVNQSSLTGEPLAVERSVGDDVFAGTAVEDGEIFVRVKSDPSLSKVRSVVALVEASESSKSKVQERMEQLADRVVPWNFFAALFVGIVTRSPQKAASMLMVDYSCALKLVGAIASMSALSESAKLGFTVKGAQHFESFATADVIVFDKTGTLTEAEPRVVAVRSLLGWSEDDVLRLSACLEEHFPHPVARAVVNAASEKGLEHREKHAAVEYIVAHGIASSLDGKRVVIGSRHFVEGDEKVRFGDEGERIAEEIGDFSSPLFLAVDGVLVGVVGIADPVKPCARAAISQLREQGFERIIMLTGDNERAAAKAAEEAGVDEYRFDMLPEDKHAFVRSLKEQGANVVVVGDGVNDSPALALADLGIAMASGTAIAKEVADVTMADGDLSSLVQFRKISVDLRRRLDRSCRDIVLLNTSLLIAGALGATAPQASSFLHNASTVYFGARNASRFVS